jgi:hypothetical protein
MNKDTLSIIAGFVDADIRRLFYLQHKHNARNVYNRNFIIFVNRGDLRRICGPHAAICKMWAEAFGPALRLARRLFVGNCMRYSGKFVTVDVVDREYSRNIEYYNFIRVDNDRDTPLTYRIVSPKICYMDFTRIMNNEDKYTIDKDAYDNMSISLYNNSYVIHYGAYSKNGYGFHVRKLSNRTGNKARASGNKAKASIADICDLFQGKFEPIVSFCKKEIESADYPFKFLHPYGTNTYTDEVRSIAYYIRYLFLLK